PADATVGVGRSANNEPPKITKEATAMTDQAPVNTDAAITEAERARTLNNIRTEEKQRVDAIRQAADRFFVEELGRQAISEGWSVADFQAKALEEVGKRNNKARAESKHDGEVDLEARDRKRFSIIRLMDAISNPNDRAARNRAAFELEVSAEAQRGFGSDFKCRGEFIPESLIHARDLSAGTATDGAELVGTNLLAGSYIEVLRNAMVTADLGITILSGLVGNVDIPRQTSGAASTWISAEDGDATEGEAQFDQVALAPKDLACYTEVTRRLLQQSTPAIEGLVMRDLAIAQALGIDKAVLYGSASSGQPRGVSLQTGINTKDLAAAAPTYAEIIEIIKKVLEDNALAGRLAWLISPAGWEDLSTTSKQASGVEGNFILGDNGRIAGYDYRVSNQVTAEEYFFGDWSQVLLGEWGGLEMNVDPYTHSLKGKIRYITFKTCDVAVRHPEAFCYAHDGIA
ncbi:MAG: phage major capsid protein, partial [Bacteroidales bacterium]|nr:phage major capsid protein [Bacteroidales bacterium]